jgi:hypothetical protein
MIWRAVMLAMQLGLLATMGIAFWLGPSNAPIFSRAERTPAPGSGLVGDTSDGTAGATGDFDWRAGSFGALFELKEYHLAMARDWLSAASAMEPPRKKPFATRAANHARRALTEGPANGYAWLFLAWAEKLNGREESARTALATSWLWAPYSRNIALSRAKLASQWWPDLEPVDRQQVLIDLVVAYDVEKEQVRDAIATDQRLRAIWRLARAYRQKLRNSEVNTTGE